MIDFKNPLHEFMQYYSFLNDIVSVERYYLNEMSLYTTGEITFPTETLSFNVFVGERHDLPSSSVLTAIDDYNTFDVVIHRNVIESLSKDVYARLNIQRYIVRVVSKLMLMITDHSPLIDINYPVITNYQPDLHKFFLNQYIETGSKLYQEQYRNVILKGILKQAYLTNEYAIDKEALKTIQDPFEYSMLLSKSVRHLQNPLIDMEIGSRIKLINKEPFPFPKPNYTIMM